MTEPLNNEALTDLLALSAWATPGPWEPYPDERGISHVASRYPERAVATADDMCLGVVAASAYDSDAAFIAAARDAVPGLIAELQDARATIERVRRSLTMAVVNVTPAEHVRLVHERVYKALDGDA